MTVQQELGIYEGSVLGSYTVESFLGAGGFGVVAKCFNTETKQRVAIKVNKNGQEFHEQATVEIANLRKLQRLDADKCNMVKWYGSFVHNDSICLTFELLDQSLHHYIR